MRPFESLEAIRVFQLPASPPLPKLLGKIDSHQHHGISNFLTQSYSFSVIQSVLGMCLVSGV